MNKKSLIVPSIVLLVAAGLLFAIAGHWTAWKGNQADQSTDDAYLRADVTPLSTAVPGKRGFRKHPVVLSQNHDFAVSLRITSGLPINRPELVCVPRYQLFGPSFAVLDFVSADRLRRRPERLHRIRSEQ